MAIDDLGRTHDCDLLLDQNYYADPTARYAAGVATTILLGPNYALLRPEFARARAGVGPRGGAVRRILLCMGGMDLRGRNLSRRSTRSNGQGLENTAPDITIGAEHRARRGIEARCNDSVAWRLHVETGDMAGLLAAADLAIGAGGTATWERCALGVPTLAIELASNQREVLREGAQAGFLYAFDDALSVDAIATHLKALVDNSGLRQHLSITALALTDGRGARRVAAMLNPGHIAIRRAEPRDCADMYVWRNASEVRAASRDGAEVAMVSHQTWFTRRLGGSKLLAAHRRARWKKPSASSASIALHPDSAGVSIYLVPAAMGGGAGGPLLSAAETWLATAAPDIRYVTAVVRGG